MLRAMRWFSFIALGIAAVLAFPYTSLRYGLLAMCIVHLIGNIYFWYRARGSA